MPYINLLNTVKFVHNGYLQLLKKALQKPGVPLGSMSLQTSLIIICFPQVSLT